MCYARSWTVLKPQFSEIHVSEIHVSDICVNQEVVVYLVENCFVSYLGARKDR